jgi:hypothetical protein
MFDGYRVMMKQSFLEEDLIEVKFLNVQEPIESQLYLLKLKRTEDLTDWEVVHLCVYHTKYERYEDVKSLFAPHFLEQLMTTLMSQFNQDVLGENQSTVCNNMDTCC